MNNFRPVLLPVYESLEAAIPVALELIEQRNWSRTPQLFSHLVRAEVKTLLNGKACPVEYDDEIRVLQMATVSMEGLAVPVGSVDFKILKGEVLRPANSEPRANFYQQSNNHLWATDEDPELKSLVILWECNANGTGLRLYLVCPMDAAGNCVWRMLIPPPAEWMIIADSSESGGGNQGGGDLDIGRKNDTDEQTGEKSR